MHGFGWNTCWGFGSLGNMGWAGWIINGIFTLALVIGLALLVIWAIRRTTSSQTSNALVSAPGIGIAGAREILQARYARGEITRDEYNRMLEDIQ